MTSVIPPRFLAATPALVAAGLLAACSGGDDAAPGAAGAAGHDRAAAPQGQGDDLGALPATPASERTPLDRNLAEKLERVDAGNDGWDSEVFGAAAGQRLGELARLFEEDRLDEGTVAAFVRAGFTGDDPSPADLATVFESDALAVERPRPGAEAVRLSGPAELARELVEMRARYAHPHTKIKVVSVEVEGKSGTTRVLFHVAGDTATGRREENATWTARWQLGRDGALKLAELAVDDYEAVAARRALLADCTHAVLGDDPSFETVILPHLETVLGTIQSQLRQDFAGYQGLAVADVDGDGLEDLYLVQAGGLPNLLYRQEPDGTAREIGAEAGVDYLDNCSSALFCDLDNDGDQDLVLATSRALVFHAGDGRGHFEERLRVDAPAVHSISAADYDEDGDLDLYACTYVVPDGTNDPPQPYFDAQNGSPNLFLANRSTDEAWEFTRAEAETGLDVNNTRFSFAAAWEDFDNDGDVDLYVANDFGRNNLYRNDGGRFTDIAEAAGVEDHSSGMSVAWGDYDRDGLFDVYVSNMFSSAGNRIAYQRKFLPKAQEETRAVVRRFARGNSLFRNLGDGTFEDVTVETGTGMGRWAWGSRFCDLDNDGLEDVLVANGFVTSDDPDDL